MKREYPWKCSWSSSDLSLTFNRREEEEEENSTIDHPKQRCVALDVTRPPSLPPSFLPSAILNRQLFRSITHLVIIKPEGRTREEEEVEEERGFWSGGGGFTNWHFSPKRGEHEDDSERRSGSEWTLPTASVVLRLTAGVGLLYSLSD